MKMPTHQWLQKEKLQLNVDQQNVKQLQREKQQNAKLQREKQQKEDDNLVNKPTIVL